MRLAAIGIALGPADLTDIAEPVRYRDATKLDGFDGVLWNPNALFDEYDGEIAEDGVLSVAGSQAFLADLRRRREDMTALLDDGGTLVIEPPAPKAIRVHTLEAIHAVPLAQALPVDGIATTPCEPAALQFQGGEPFRSFWQRAGAALAPVVRIESPPGEVLLCAGADVFGCYWAHRRGRLLLLPPPRPAARRNHVEAVAALIDALGGEEGHRPPKWTRRYVARDEAPLRATHDRLERERADLDRRLADTRRALLPLERRKKLFTAAGRPLVEAVSDAFWTLGCDVLQGPFGDRDLMIERGADAALALVVGSTGPVDPAALDRLDGWIATLAARGGTRPRGWLIANPHRGLPPAQRPVPDKALCDQAAAHGHLVISGFDLLGTVVAAGAATEAKRAVVTAMFAATGLWRGDPEAWHIAEA
jgi:hypothetical protein